ncbi:MAG: hypothetical protein ACXADY_13940 [Candidatus Hodarchaeales archaeon]|jgi:hypothetical protein
MKKKKCTRCSVIKTTNNFYRDNKSPDGLRYWCKNCLIEYNQRCKEKRNEKVKEYNRSYYAKHRKRNLQYARIYRKRKKIQLEAQYAVQRALRKGELVRPNSCSNPNCKEIGISTLEAHHKNYGKEHWFDVEWLCPSCHKLKHIHEITSVKRCSQCREMKPTYEFHKNKTRKDGLSPQCKECVGKRAKRRYKARREEYITKQREYSRRNMEKERERLRKYYQNHRQVVLERITKHKEMNPHKNKARMELAYAIEKRDIIRPEICSECRKSSDNIQAHHEDYSKPLDVQWLCPSCHNRLHFEMVRSNIL